MSGYGSGRHARGAARSDQFQKLDLAGLPRRWFEDRRAGTLTWSRGGHKTGSISYWLWPASMRLIYTLKRHGEPVDVDETFQLAFTEQPFGGARWWISFKGAVGGDAASSMAAHASVAGFATGSHMKANMNGSMRWA